MVEGVGRVSGAAVSAKVDGYEKRIVPSETSFGGEAVDDDDVFVTHIHFASSHIGVVPSIQRILLGPHEVTSGVPDGVHPATARQMLANARLASIFFIHVKGERSYKDLPIETFD